MFSAILYTYILDFVGLHVHVHVHMHVHVSDMGSKMKVANYYAQYYHGNIYMLIEKVDGCACVFLCSAQKESLLCEEEDPRDPRNVVYCGYCSVHYKKMVSYAEIHSILSVNLIRLN